MYITDIVYLLDGLVVIVYMSYCNCWDYLLLHENWGECSEDWAGACRWGGVEYLTENFFSLRNVPGVLKRKKKKKKKFFGGGGAKNFRVFFPTKFFFFQKCSFIFRGGGFWGVWGAPRPHPGVARGRKTIHFFL